jgi:16S rRNA C967 or C1407 C5-methylase (RsmB/RsmF family)
MAGKFTIKRRGADGPSSFNDRKRDFRSGQRPPQNTLNKKQMIMKAFDELWAGLFSSPVHLDSLLSKQAKPMKSSLARMVSPILLRPVSESESYGVGVAPGEPWNLATAYRSGDKQAEELAQWRTARLVADKVYDSLSNPPESAAPTSDDFPPYMVAEIERDHGAEVAKQLFRTLGREAPLGLRAARKWGPEKLVKELKKGSDIPVSIDVSDIAPLGVRLGGYAQVFSNPAYEEGAFEIQDEGSQIMALFALWPEVFKVYLQDKPGARKPLKKSVELPADFSAWKTPPTVIDACAGAGGKSLAIADALKGKGRVYAYDTSDKKLQALMRRGTRAGLNNIQTLMLENEKESEKLTKFLASAQVVLVDAPCSGWGVLRRNPDIKWRQDPSVLTRMPQIQGRLLSTYSSLVAPDGTLVYGLCTFRKAETTEVVEAFLKKHPEFSSIAGGYLGPGPCDGFYRHAFRKKG